MPDPTSLVFGTASLSEVEAVIITAVLAGVLATWGVITQRIVARRQATVEYLKRLQSDCDMLQSRTTFNELSELSGKLSVYCKPTDLTPAETQAVAIVLNDYELMAVAVQFGVLDLKILSMARRSTILRDWERAAPFVYKLRSELRTPSTFHEFEELARWLADNRLPRRSSWTRLWF